MRFTLEFAITFFEGDFVQQLKSLQSTNQAVQDALTCITSSIRATARYSDKNSYSSAIRLLQRDKQGIFQEGFQNGHFRDAEHWVNAIKNSNPWLVQPPFFSYRYLPDATEQTPAQYVYQSGTFEFNEAMTFSTLQEWCNYIHELIHILQFQRLTQTSSSEQIANFRSYFESPPAAIYIIDFETDAFAASLEIVNLMTNGELEKFVRKNAAAQTTGRIRIQDSDQLLMVRLCGNNPTDINLGFFNYAIPYFLDQRPYPERAQALEAVVRKIYVSKGTELRVKDLQTHKRQR